MIHNTFLANLHTFFSDQSKHNLVHKIVFAPGTAPMRKENSEIEEILFATDFEKAYFVDPVYSVEGKDSPLSWDIASIKKIDPHVILGTNEVRTPESDQKDSGRAASGTVWHPTALARMTVRFLYENKHREVIFIPGDATIAENIPKDFTIVFSGKRIGLYPGVGLRGTPSEYLHEIVKKLPVGGYVVPDRALLDDTVFFLLPPEELGLKEIQGIRTQISRSQFPTGYSEDKRFINAETARGVGLYKKVT